MANPALAHRNLFDTAEITASSYAASTPPSMLQNPHIANKWRGEGGATDNFTATWASDQIADSFMARGLGSTFLSTGTVRLQLTSNGGSLGDVYDSGATAGLVDPSYGYVVILRPAPLTFRSAKWTFAQAGASYIEAGRAAAMVRTPFTYGMVPGAQRGWVTNTKRTQSDGGQTFIDRSSGQARFEEFTLGWVDEAQRWALHEAIDLANADHTDVLLIKDTASANMGRDCIWGLLDTVSPVIQPFNHGTLYSRSLRIIERL